MTESSNEIATPTTPAAWFSADRFGLFVHFGLYSMAARHEWVMSNEKTSTDDYQRYADHFDPDLFDATAIAREAKKAGAKYVVLTAKHHEGFALWNTAVSEYSSVQTCGRDLVAEFVDAVRAEGLRVGLYFSLLDWHHPDYLIDAHHPRRDHPDARAENAAKHPERYREFLHAQVTELLTDYGQIDYLFYDFTDSREADGWPGKTPEDWDSERLLATTRRLQPGIVVNDRLGIPGDLVTPEQYQPSSPPLAAGIPVAWEACQTLNGSWGYDRDNLAFKEPDLLLRMLIDTVSKNGNFLLNIGPDGRGGMAERDRSRLAAIGEWMRRNGRAVYGAGASEFTAPSGTVLTSRADRLYLHLLHWPFGHVHLPGLAGRVRYAQLLHDGSEIAFEESDPQRKAFNTEPGGQPAGTLTLTIPPVRPDAAVPVIELFLSNPPQASVTA